ncbi:prepilin-type N-terminal cleavage/methylation domain-containing protein [Verrucomicrobiota bacterium]
MSMAEMQNCEAAGEGSAETQRGRSRRGFTLAEVMVASGIVALVFTGFMIGFVQALRLQYLANVHYCASVVARNRIEQARIYAFGAVEVLEETSEVTVDRYGDENSTGTYYRTTLVTTPAVNPNCREVIVNVWYEIRPGVRSPAPVTISTWVGATH